MPNTSNKIPSLRTYALAARRAAKRTEGVAGLDGCACEWLCGGVPGVCLREEDRHRFFLEVQVIAQMHERLESLGQRVQEAIIQEFAALPGRRAVAIDIIITGIRFDKRALPKPKEYPR